MLYFSLCITEDHWMLIVAWKTLLSHARHPFALDTKQ